MFANRIGFVAFFASPVGDALALLYQHTEPIEYCNISMNKLKQIKYSDQVNHGSNLDNNSLSVPDINP